MRPYPFRYIRAESAHHAMVLWHDAHGDAAFLSGGQDLLPALNAAQRTPAVVIDLKTARDLEVRLADNWTTLAATTPHLGAGARPGSARWADYSEILGPVPIRARATVGGHIAAGTPGRFWPTLLTALDGRIEILSSAGRQLLNAGEALDILAESPTVICGIAVAPSAYLIGVGQADVGTSSTGPGTASCVLRITVERGQIVGATAAGCVGLDRPSRLPELEGALCERDVVDLKDSVASAVAGVSDWHIALRAAAIAAINDLTGFRGDLRKAS